MLKISSESTQLLNEIKCVELYGPEFETKKHQVSWLLLSSSLTHAESIQMLIKSNHYTSICCLIESQFDALLKGLVVQYNPNISLAEAIFATLNISNATKQKLPNRTLLLKQLKKFAPAQVFDMLNFFEKINLPKISLLTNGAFLYFQREKNIQPLSLYKECIKHSNSLSTMAGMALSLLTGSNEISLKMSKIQKNYSDCLPPLNYDKK